MGLADTEGLVSASRGETALDAWFPWTFRRILALPGPPLAIGAGAILLSLVVDAAWFNASGTWQGYRVQGIPIWLHPYTSYNLSYAVFLGFAVVALRYLAPGADRDLRELGPALRLEGGPLAEVRRAVLSVPARSLRIGTAMGLAVAAFDLWIMATYMDLEPVTPTGMVWVVAREVLYDVLVFRVLAWAILVALRLSRLARKQLRVDLVDLRPLRPFTHNGMRLALFWLLLWAIWVPMLFVNPMEPNAFLAFSLLIAGQMALTAIAITIPTLGARRCVGEAKSAELTNVRGAIQRDRLAALDGNHPDRAGAAGRLPGLLAYEARIEAVPAWLLDSQALRRLGLYLLIPLASWVGGAIIERLVDAALD